jgi:hypothetical protein
VPSGTTDLPPLTRLVFTFELGPTGVSEKRQLILYSLRQRIPDSFVYPRPRQCEL